MTTVRNGHANGGKAVPVTLQATRVPALGQSAGRDGVNYAVVAEDRPAAQESEKRQGSRQRARLKSGKVVDIDNRFITECVFHNRSTRGARLRLVRQVKLPNVIKIYDDQNSTLVPAHVVWQRQGELGIRFDWQLHVTEARRAFMAALGDKFYAIPD